MRTRGVVRPRRVWSGLLAVLLGCVLLGFWIDSWHVWALVAGAALIVIGGPLMLWGGALYNTDGAGEATPAQRDSHQESGIVPGEMLTDDLVRRRARDTSRRTDELLEASQGMAPPAFDRVGGAFLLLGALLLWVAQGLYPHTGTGQGNAMRSLLLAAVVALAALRILLGERPGPLASGIALLAGVTLVLFGLLAPHDRTATVALETGTGAWIVLGGVLSLDHRRHAHERAVSRAVAGLDEEYPSRRGRGLAGLVVVTLVVGHAVGWLVHAVRRRHHSHATHA